MKAGDYHLDYHGIVINRSQKDRAVFDELDVIGKKRFLLGLITFHKIMVKPDDLGRVIKRIQGNMSSRFLFKKQEYYAHFYRGDELIIVFRDKTFKATTDKKTWGKAIEHGKALGIAAGQLDFVPNRVEDERF